MSSPGLALRMIEYPGRVGGCLGAAFHAELGEQRGDVVLDGLLGEVHPLADLPVGEALPDEFQDLAFLRRQAGQRGPSCSPGRASGPSPCWPHPGRASTRRKRRFGTAPTRSVPQICLSTYPAAPAMIASNSASSSPNDVGIRQAISGIPGLHLPADGSPVAVGQPHVQDRDVIVWFHAGGVTWRACLPAAPPTR